MLRKINHVTKIFQKLTSIYSHELQTCDWPRNVGCGADAESATISTVRVTDPRTRQTTPTGSSSR